MKPKRYISVAVIAFEITAAVFQFAHGSVLQGWFLVAIAVFMIWATISANRNQKKLDEADERLLKAMKDYYNG